MTEAYMRWLRGNFRVFNAIFLLLIIAPVALAQDLPSPVTGEVGKEILGMGAEAAAIPLRLPVDVLAAADLRIYIAGLVRIALSFIGILFIGLMAFGGALWFLSKGNEETVKKAKGVLSRGVIGLVIVLSSYGIASLVQWALVKAAVEEDILKVQDPNLLSSCGALWTDYQNCLTDVNCTESKAGKIYKQWSACTKK